MEIPNLVRERLGGESIEATVNLGDEDVIAVTPTRTILYRGEGLLSDESVSVYSHDVERLLLSTGRRNTKFSLSYVDGTKEFKVPSDRTETLLQILMQGILRSAGVAGEDESVAGVFQFSELTLVVTESRLVKHIGTPVWDSDFEVFDYDDVTALDFEEGSVATQIILTVNGRPQRIKAPADQAPQVEQTLTQTLCSYYDVRSLEELTATLGREEDDTEDSDDEAAESSNELELDDGISPLVGRSDEETADTAERTPEPEGGATAAASPESVGPDRSEPGDALRESGGSAPTADTDGTSRQSTSAPTSQPASTPAADAGTAEDIEAIKDQLSTLTEAVKRQNELLRQHNERLAANDERVEQLIEELRRGR